MDLNQLNKIVNQLNYLQTSHDYLVEVINLLKSFDATKEKYDELIIKISTHLNIE